MHCIYFRIIYVHHFSNFFLSKRLFFSYYYFESRKWWQKIKLNDKNKSTDSKLVVKRYPESGKRVVQDFWFLPYRLENTCGTSWFYRSYKDLPCKFVSSSPVPCKTYLPTVLLNVWFREHIPELLFLVSDGSSFSFKHNLLLYHFDTIYFLVWLIFLNF